jgi:predicted RNase H-like HicB family nuclease
VSDKTYRVVVTREDGTWLADVPGLDVGTHTYAKTLASLDQRVREAIALAEDLPRGDEVEAGLSLDYEYNIGSPELNEAAAKLRAERERIKRAERELAGRTAEVANALVSGEHLSARDAAVLLAVSHQRVAQVAPQRKEAAG